MHLLNMHLLKVPASLAKIPMRSLSNHPTQPHSYLHSPTTVPKELPQCINPPIIIKICIY